MPIIRQLLVYDKAIHQKVEKILAKENPVFKHEGETSVLVVIRSRNDVGQMLLGKKIPKKTFRQLWIDDEGDFARTGSLIDTEYGAAFVVTEELKIRIDAFERIQQAYEADKFVSVFAAKKEPVTNRAMTKQAIKFKAATCALSYEMFLSSEIERKADGAFLQITVEYPLRASYDADPADWIVELLDMSEYSSSLRTHWAVDLDDWWSHRQRGVVEAEHESLCASLVAAFHINDIHGHISAQDAIVDGRSVE